MKCWFDRTNFSNLLSIFDNLCRLIAGFIKKETAEQRLKNNLQQPQEYTYLLRFSDKVITDGQGQNLCGAISATVLYKNQKGITFKEICYLEFCFLWIIRIYEYTIFVGIFNLGIDSHPPRRKHITGRLIQLPFTRSKIWLPVVVTGICQCMNLYTKNFRLKWVL